MQASFTIEESMQTNQRGRRGKFKNQISEANGIYLFSIKNQVTYNFVQGSWKNKNL